MRRNVKLTENSKVVLKGDLQPEDKKTLTAILILTGKIGKDFALKIKDLSRFMALKKPYHKETLDKVRASVDRLLNSRIQLYDKNNLMSEFVFLEGIQNYKDDTVFGVVSNDIYYIVRILNDFGIDIFNKTK